MSTRFCQHCGLPADDQAMLCTSCGNALPPPLPGAPDPPPPDPRTMMQPTVAPPTLVQPTMISEIPATLAPPTIIQPTFVQPTQHMAHPPVVISVPPTVPPSGGRRGSGVVIGLLLGFLVIGAIVVVGVKLLDKKSGNNASTAVGTVAPAPSATAVVATTLPTPTPTPLATTPAIAVAPTVVVETTVPVVVAATTAATAATPVPTTPPVAGPGVSQVLRDPMSDGVPFADVSSSFQLAQQLADALAADDWDRARQLEPAKRGFTDAQYAGYKGLDRASLILVDARPEGDGYRNLVVSVANENNGTRTTLFCLEWSASAATGAVVQHSGVVGKLTTLDGLVSSATVVSDPDLLNLVMSKCVWS
jgi:hypothetical protein